MGKENMNEEIDLIQLFKFIRTGFIAVLKGVFAIGNFYKKKAILFLIVLIVGGVLGYFFDKNVVTSKKITQEIILEPKYGSIDYLYKTIEMINDNISNPEFASVLKLSKEELKNIKKIEIEPLIQASNVLDDFYNAYQNKGGLPAILERLDQEKLKEEKYIGFFKFHKITFQYVNENAKESIGNIILEYIKSNPFYAKNIQLKLAEKRRNIDSYKNTLKFIDDYLIKLNQVHEKSEGSIALYANENDIPTVASLIKEKQIVLEKLGHEEYILSADKEVFSVMYYSGILKYKKGVFYKVVVLIPLVSFVLISLFYFMIYLKRSAQKMIFSI